MSKIFKRAENDLIWESYTDKSGIQIDQNSPIYAAAYEAGYNGKLSEDAPREYSDGDNWAIWAAGWREGDFDRNDNGDEMSARGYDQERRDLYGDEDAEAIISLEPPMQVQPEIVEDEPDMFGDEEDDLDNEIITKALRKLIKRADILLNHCAGESLDTWMVAKIIKAEDYISDVWNELDDIADFANDGPEEDEITF